LGESLALDDAFTRSRLVFWDFDGVIKDSVAVKTEAFVQLFSPFGDEVSARVRMHHEANGGMSRFEKIPKYLEWAGVPVTDLCVEEYCCRFSDIVLRRVVAAPWVAGVEHLLRDNPYRQEFVLVTATPQGEIEEILQAINLRECFTDVFGAPTRKGDAIRNGIVRRGMPPAQCLMIGDAVADMEAAAENEVPFLLRRYPGNQHMFREYSGAFVEDFIGR
jgi:phosphoglycolate phosphatase-like HAD superfamily hydrolase